MINKKVLALCTSLALAVGSSAVASYWDGGSGTTFPSTGTNSRFGWSAGWNNTGHFGIPAIVPAGFLYNNTVDFRADVDLGVLSVTDFTRVTVDVTAATPGAAPSIDTIIVREWGTYGGDPLDFTYQIDFSIFRIAPIIPPFTMPGSTGALSLPAITFLPDGTWSTERTLNVGDPLDNPPGNPPIQWNVAVDVFQIDVTNTLQVDGLAVPGTFIEKSGMRIIVPEPGTMLLLTCLGPLLLRRSRRRR